ncbi:MAG: phosphoglycolate phosphatase [Terricaulis silvestris]
MNSEEFAGATIVFDLDGTLVDSAPDLARALNETLDLEGLPPMSVPTVRRLVGQGARALIERAASRAGAHFSAEKLDQLTEAYVDNYRRDIASGSSIYPDAPDALAELAGSGALLSVCTNKRTDLAVRLLEALDLAGMFAAIVGADAAPNRKPHADHYRAAVERAGGVVRRSMMVGDTATDVAAAKAAGAPVALVRFGYAEDEVERLGADALVDRYSDLVSTCRRLLPARS